MKEHDDVLQKILEILAVTLPEGGPEIKADLDLIDDLGLDSMKVLEILESLEDSFDISIPMNVMPGVRTANDLARELQKIIKSE
ncbi:phosphopantetheine-binding protein [Desulfopila aestuarii]|uniref:Acyl carrier protein n=1 Tax=Desulfopila aestuarii DSM 18488 TaxID=1121416 RepID=A0A1M7YGY3_9BACT|nr:phosphopantetheine-binding protein [Desulfopila aestuarii]SHO51856.1 acyl carrier protein [Desulfopila aestuarii DSM 18488]